MKTENINNIHSENSNETVQNQTRPDGTDPVETPPGDAQPESPTRRRTPGFVKKPRGDSQFWRMPEQMQEIIIDHLESHTLLETVEYLRKTGMETSKSAVARFRAGYLMRQDRMEDESALEIVACEPEENRANLTREELFEVGQRRLMARAIRLGDDKAWARLHRLRQHEDWLALQVRRVTALEARNPGNAKADSRIQTNGASGHPHATPNEAPEASRFTPVEFRANGHTVGTPAPFRRNDSPVPEEKSESESMSQDPEPVREFPPQTTEKSPCSRIFPPVPEEKTKIAASARAA